MIAIQSNNKTEYLVSPEKDFTRRESNQFCWDTKYFFRTDYKVYADDLLIATLNVDDNVRNGILEISNISDTDLKPLVAQLQSSIQSVFAGYLLRVGTYLADKKSNLI